MTLGTRVCRPPCASGGGLRTAWGSTPSPREGAHTKALAISPSLMPPREKREVLAEDKGAHTQARGPGSTPGMYPCCVVGQWGREGV